MTKTIVVFYYEYGKTAYGNVPNGRGYFQNKNRHYFFEGIKSHTSESGPHKLITLCFGNHIYRQAHWNECATRYSYCPRLYAESFIVREVRSSIEKVNKSLKGEDFWKLHRRYGYYYFWFLGYEIKIERTDKKRFVVKYPECLEHKNKEFKRLHEAKTYVVKELEEYIVYKNYNDGLEFIYYKIDENPEKDWTYETLYTSYALDVEKTLEEERLQKEADIKAEQKRREENEARLKAEEERRKIEEERARILEELKDVDDSDVQFIEL